MRPSIWVILSVLGLAAAGVLYFLLAGDGRDPDPVLPPGAPPRLPGAAGAPAPEDPAPPPSAPVGAAPFREPEAPAGSGATAVEAGPRFVISGTVVDPVARTPVPGVVLRIASAAGGASLVLDPTDSQGRFGTGRAVPSGPAEIRVRNRFPGVDPREPEADASILRLIVGRDPTEGLQLENPYGGALLVRVRDEGGPVAGADVRVLAAAAASLGVTSGFPAGRTGDDGSLRVDGLRPERPVVVSAAAEGRAPATSEAVGPGPSVRPTEVEIRLRRGGSIAGSVLGSDGAPVGGVAVSAWSPSRGLSSLRATSGADGRFVIEGVAPGAWQVRAQEMVREETAPGTYTFAPGESATAEVTVGDGERAEVELRFAGGPAIEGIVEDSEGQPVSGCTVLAQGVEGAGGLVSVASDPRGRFKFRGVAPGRHRLSASGGPFEAADPVEVEAGTRDAKLVVPRARVELLIRVSDAVSGEPVPGAEVFVRGGMIMTTTSAGADGTTSLRTPPGAYRVYAGAAGRAPEARDVPVTAADEGRKEVEFRLGPGRRVSGKVIDAKDRPLAGVQIVVVLDDTKAFRSSLAVTAADGTFVLDGVPVQGGQAGVLKDFLPHPVVPADGAFLVIRCPGQ